MNDDNISPAETSIAKRRWFRLHPSTYCFLAILCIPYLLIAIPTATFEDIGIRLHGWPAIHCAQLEHIHLPNGKEPRQTFERMLFDREDQGILVEQHLTNEESRSRRVLWSKNSFVHSQYNVRASIPLRTFWSDADNWRLLSSERYSHWFPIGVVVNLGSFIFFVFASATAMEWLRRRKNRWYQISMLEVGGMFVIVGLITTIILNEHRETIRKSKSMDDFAKVNHKQLTCNVWTKAPCWLDRITNYSFDLEARGNWGWVDNRKYNPTTRLPYFSGISNMSFVNGIANVDKAISAVEGLAPEDFKFHLMPYPDNQALEFADRLNPKGITNLQLNVGASEAEFLRRFIDLEFLFLEGDLRASHIEALQGLQLKGLRLRPSSNCQIDSSFADELAKLTQLQHLTIGGRPETMQVINRLPLNLKSFSTTISIREYDGAPDFDLSLMPDLNKLNHLDLLLQRSKSVPDSNVVLGRMDRFPQLETLEITFDSRSNPTSLGITPIIGNTVKLSDLGFEFHTIPELVKLNLVGFEFNEETLTWIASHKKLRYLFLGHNIPQEIKDRLKQALPGIGW